MKLLQSGLRFPTTLVDYDSIQAWLAYLNGGARGRTKREYHVDDFLVLSTSNDPFYANSPYGQKWGKWFYDNWQQCMPGSTNVHVRGLHYRMQARANTATPILMPDGRVYKNTELCWDKLEIAGKCARYN